MDEVQKEWQAWKKLGKVSEDFVKVAHVLYEASYEVRRRQYSEKVVFLMSQEPLQWLSSLLVKPPEYKVSWYYYISYQEALAKSGLITQKELFEKKYKPADEYSCLIVIPSQPTPAPPIKPSAPPSSPPSSASPDAIDPFVLFLPYPSDVVKENKNPSEL